MRGHERVIAARMAGTAPVALTFFVTSGDPWRLGHIHVTAAEAKSKTLDLRFVLGLPVLVNGFAGHLQAARALFDRLTHHTPCQLFYAAPTWFLEWTPEEGQIEWEA
jgi:hypothetical protein